MASRSGLATLLHGSYYNVMGLPVQRIYQELQKLRV